MISTYKFIQNRATVYTFVITTIGILSILIFSLYLLQYQANASMKIISEDIGRDILVSNFASIDRRIEVLKKMGQLGLDFEIDESLAYNISSSNCISKVYYPIIIDGQELGRISNCISLNNYLKLASKSPSVVALILIMFLLILAGYAVRLWTQRIKFESEKNREIGIISRQVAHDIRSPLTALNVVMSTTNELPEEKRLLIRHAVQRINDIANNLLEKGRATSADSSLNYAHASTNNILSSTSKYASLNCHTEPSAYGIGNITLDIAKNLTQDITPDNTLHSPLQLVSTLIDSLISEKRTQYRDKINIQIEADLEQAYGLFANIKGTELQRVLSNLINNSVEAMPDDKGLIKVSVRGYDHDNNISIIVFDTGKGIPQNILNKLGTESITHGKDGTKSGHGLGIPHAKKIIENFGGEFKIQSRENEGTMITLTLPKQNPPMWFAEEIQLKPNSLLISVDDDLSIHQVWDEKLKTELTKNQIKHISFTSVQVFKDWFNAQKAEDQKNRLFLVDHEFINDKTTGLNLIESLNIADQSILITSHFDEADIRSRCENLSVKIIPKAMAGLTPVKLIS